MASGMREMGVGQVGLAGQGNGRSGSLTSQKEAGLGAWPVHGLMVWDLGPGLCMLQGFFKPFNLW